MDRLINDMMTRIMALEAQPEQSKQQIEQLWAECEELNRMQMAVVELRRCDAETATTTAKSLESFENLVDFRRTARIEMRRYDECCTQTVGQGQNASKSVARIAMSDINWNLEPKIILDRGAYSDKDSAGQPTTLVTEHACDQCDRVYVREAELQHHKLHHLDVRRHPCVLCSEKFHSPDHLNAHMQLHSGAKPFLCTFCNKQFGRHSDLKAHRRRHSDEIRFVCYFCQERFDDKTALNDHIEEHAGRAMFRCDECGKSCSTERSLQMHRWAHVNYA